MVKAMRQALKISNEESDEMQGTLEGIGPLLADERPGVARMKRFLASQTAGLSRRLLGAMKGVGLFVERIEWLAGQLGELEKGEFAPLPLITGDDLTAAGLRPGPMFKRILERVYDGQLEGRVKDREEAMRMAMEMGSEKGKTRG
jgi:poly(A) polymerase